MSEPLENQLADAIQERDAVLVRRLMEQAEFVLLTVNSDETDEAADDDEDGPHVMSKEVDGMELVVAFTNDQAAGDFVHSASDLYQDDEDVQGYVLDGDALLQYMPPEYGLLLNPESDPSMIIDGELLGLVQKAES